MVVDPITTFDTRRLEEYSPDDAMTQLREDADDRARPFLFYPPDIEYYGGLDAFEQRMSAVEPVSITEQHSDGGPGIVLDCVRPVRVE